MHFNIISIFPELFSKLDYGVLGRAKSSKILSIQTINPRTFSTFKNKKIDESQYGDETGMVMIAEPLKKALSSIHYKRRGKVVLMSPQGEALNNAKIQDLASQKYLTIVCGRYEGIDQRFIDKYVDEEISIGDYVLTGGELPALVLIDAVSRFIPGVVGKLESVENDSFFNGLLKGPVYTRPRNFEGMEVPAVLLSGNHNEIHEWRTKMSLIWTLSRKPGLLEGINLTKKQKKLLEEIDSSIIL